MAVENLTQLLKHELGDILYAERTFLKGLKKMSKEVRDPKMKSRIEQHAAETEDQIVNVEKAFDTIGYAARAQKCDAAVGLKEEHDNFIEDEEPNKAMLEAFDVGSGLRVEHYEIAAYRTAIAISEALGNAECSRLLNANLEQEVAMATFIERNALGAMQKLEGMAEKESAK